MPPELSADSQFEIGHVLFIDIVGYSKLLIEEQSERLGELTSIVLGTAQVRDSTDEKLVRLPTGDGMALVFHHSAEEPARCALEISEALRKHPELCVRMGIHSGPVREVNDVSGRKNIAGAGINMAQRVMDCGDAGHILLSQHVADDLMQYRQWAPRLRDLGDCEVKHGVRLHLVNLYAEPLGNPEVPEKFRQVAASATASAPMPSPVVKPKRMPWHEIVIALLFVAAVIAAGFFYLRKGAAPGASAGVPEKSIAVLPFENLSKDEENAYFADGVQDQILTNLAQIADLKVISRTSVMQYKTGAPRNLRDIGQQLGVARVVEGSVQRAANKVRVTAQLLDARNDTHLWAQSYDRDLADVFAIQSEIAKAIADQLQAKLSPKEKKAIEQPPTTDLAAFDLYSRAKSLLLTANFSATNTPDLRKAIELLDEAVKRDPSFFDAYCQLAYAHESIYAGGGSDHTPARLALAEAALQAARRLRPDAAETHLARAYYLYQGLRDYAGALAELEIARRALPNDPRLFQLTGYILRRRGQQEIYLSRSFGEGLLARITKDEARARTAFAAARAQQEKIVQAQPDYGPALCVLGLIDAALGRKDLALDEGRRAIALTPVEKDVNNGSRILQYFAITAAWAGEKELALQQLEAGLRAPAASTMLSYGALKLFPAWDPLRGDPRFEKIVASLAPK